MNSRGRWAKALVRLFLLSAPIGLLILAACRSSSPAEFNLQYACLGRSLPPCLAAGKFADRVADRTDGRVQIEITSYSDLRIMNGEVLTRLKDGTLDMGEVHRGNFPSTGDGAAFDIYDFWGLYQDYGTQAQVSEAIGKEIEGIIAERSGSVVLSAQFYPSHYIFSRKPLRTTSDIQGVRIRFHNRLSKDLLTGMGAIAEEDVHFGAVYAAMQSGQLGAAISCSSCGAGLKWYYFDYLVGPIPALGHSWITISRKKWSDLPPDIQVIIQEEAARHEVATKRASLARWDQLGVQQNVSGGMEHIELTPELKGLMRTAALTTMLPNWVNRAGGHDSNAVKLFNQKIAHIVKVEITEEGEAKEIR